MHSSRYAYVCGGVDTCTLAHAGVDESSPALGYLALEAPDVALVCVANIYDDGLGPGLTKLVVICLRIEVYTALP